MAHGEARSRLPRLSPVRRQRMYEVLADHIVDFVEAQGLTPGQRLPPERALAEQLGVSRATLSQALVALEVKGVVDVRHGDGAVLVPPADRRPGCRGGEACAGAVAASRAQAEEALAVLLPELAAMAAERREASDVATLDAAVAATGTVTTGEHRGAGGSAPVRTAGTAALLAVIGPLSRSPVVEAMARQAALLTAAAPITPQDGDIPRGADTPGSAATPAGAVAGTVAAVMAAVARGDADAARHAALAHVRRGARPADDPATTGAPSV